MKISCLGLVLGLLSVNACAGNELGNGGDSYAQEFVALGRKLVESLGRHADPRIADLASLRDAVEGTRVTTRNQLDLRGAEVDAINYPEAKKIELNRARWKESDLRQKASLVLHEYLGIAGVDDGNYQISSAYLELPDLSAPGAPPAFAGRAGGFFGNESVARLDGAGQAPAPRRWSFGLGTSVAKFGGNIGKLYDTAISPELRVGYQLLPDWALKLVASRGEFSFPAADQGRVSVGLLSVNGNLEFHPRGESRSSGPTGFDPYVTAGIGQVFRTQSYGNLNQVGKDNALLAGVGAGLNWFFAPRIGLTLEAKLSSVLFKDRYDDTYANSGVEDTTGALYAMNVGVQYLF